MTRMQELFYEILIFAAFQAKRRIENTLCEAD